MSVSSVFTTLVIVVGLFFVSVAIVANDPDERPFLKRLLPELLPVLYGILSILALLWLILRDFSPLGDLGDRLLYGASGHTLGDSWGGFFVSYFGGIFVSIANVLLMLAIILFAVVMTFWAVQILVIMLPDLARLILLTAKRIWWWVLDLFVHPPSIKTIRETLRSGEPSAERVRKIATVLKEEQEKVMNEKLSAEIIKAYARKHDKFAKELSIAEMNARAEYNEAIAKTAQGLRDSAVRREGMSSGEGRDE